MDECERTRAQLTIARDAFFTELARAARETATRARRRVILGTLIIAASGGLGGLMLALVAGGEQGALYACGYLLALGGLVGGGVTVGHHAQTASAAELAARHADREAGGGEPE